MFGLRPLVRTKSLPVRFKKNKDSCALCLDRNCTAMKKALNNVSKEVSREVEAARELSAKLSLFVVPLPHISNLHLSTLDPGVTVGCTATLHHGLHSVLH